ncbi:MAG: CPBP family intramembrane glutamic endopeptidase [Planctomycetota bacterium]
MLLELTTEQCNALTQLSGALAVLLCGAGTLGIAWHLCSPLVKAAPRPATRLGLGSLAEVALVFLALWIGISTLAFQLAGEAPRAEPTAASADQVDGPARTLGVVAGFVVITIANLFTAAYIVLINQRRGGRVADFGLRRSRFGPTVLFTIGLYIGFVPIVYGLLLATKAIYLFFDLSLPQQAAVEALAKDPAVMGNLFFIAGVCVTTPILEEFIFRGFLYGVLRQFLPVVPAMALSALAFGILHDARVPLILVLAGFLAFLYERTGSLLAPVLCHIVHNSATILLIRLWP